MPRNPNNTGPKVIAPDELTGLYWWPSPEDAAKAHRLSSVREWIYEDSTWIALEETARFRMYDPQLVWC